MFVHQFKDFWCHSIIIYFLSDHGYHFLCGFLQTMCSTQKLQLRLLVSSPLVFTNLLCKLYNHLILAFYLLSFLNISSFWECLALMLFFNWRLMVATKSPWSVLQDLLDSLSHLRLNYRVFCLSWWNQSDSWCFHLDFSNLYVHSHLFLHSNKVLVIIWLFC